MMLLKAELLALAVMLSVGVITPGGGGTLEGLLQLGALGLCGLMVWQNDRARRDSERQFRAERMELLKVIREQQTEQRESQARVETLHGETIEVIRKCTR